MRQTSPSTLVATWTGLIKALQQHADTPGSGSRAAVSDGLNNVWRIMANTMELPHAALKTLVEDAQVTRKLAALCIQAQQRAADSFAQHKTCFALHLWLLQTRAAPRQSSVSASVWQQLQESGVLQHVPAILAGAADELDAVAALLAAGDGTVCGKGSRSSGRLVAEGSRADHALQGAQTALQVYYLGCSLAMVDSAGSFSYSPGLALPAAPAAVRLGLTALRVCSVPQLQAAPMSAVSATVTCVTRTTHDILLGITTTLLRVHVKAVSHPPGAKELLLSPHIMPCLAIMVVVGLLGLNIGSAAPASANLGSSGGSSSAGRNQQPRSTAAAGRAMMERWQTQLTLSGLAERLNPHLTTPLAASLFDMLGVDKDMAVKTAVVAYSGNGLSLERFRLLHDTYCEVLRYQVQQAKGKALSQQLMLQLETDMLLALLVCRLTVDLPGRSPWADVAHLPLTLLVSLLPGSTVDGRLHCVPLEAAYTGPQVALQVWPTPPNVGAQQPQQQPSQQTGSAQAPVNCVVAPTAAVLAEMLPLLTKCCLTSLESLEARRQQQQQPQSAAKGAAGGAQAAAAANVPGAASSSSSSTSTSNATARPGAAGGTSLNAYTSLGAEREVICACLSRIKDQLIGVVVPAGTAADAAAPRSAAAAAACNNHAVSRGYSCVVHAQEAIMPHVVDILRVLEWVVRDTAAQASTSGALGVFPLGVESFPLTYAAGVASSLCAHTSERPSALVVLALAAGPGSRVQRQLYSLLCTLLKALEVVRTAVAGGCAMIL